MPTPALELNQVTRRFSRSGIPAVDGVSLTVDPGTLLALVGESGSGKTTLLRLMCGLEVPDAGKVAVRGVTVASPSTWTPPEKRNIGMVFQNGALFPHLTVERNIGYGLKGLEKKERSHRIDRLLHLVGMDTFQKRYPHELSGGERQRLALARALAPEPDVVLMDEPFSNLDPALRLSLRSEVHRILKQLNTTAILVTHDTEDALHVGDRIAVLRSGRICQIGSPREVFHRPVDGYCARMFGTANRVEDRWVRPEDMQYVSGEHPDAVQAVVESVQDTGRHCELRVKPVTSTETDVWILYHTGPDRPSTGEQIGVLIS